MYAPRSQRFWIQINPSEMLAEFSLFRILVFKKKSISLVCYAIRRLPALVYLYFNELILFVGKFFSFMQQQTIATREEDLPQYHNMEDPLGGLFVLYASAGWCWYGTSRKCNQKFGNYRTSFYTLLSTTHTLLLNS